MLQTIWNHFSSQFSLLFQMLCPILLTVLPFKTPTADWWKTFNSHSGSTKRLVLKCNTESKTEYTIWKSYENWTEKWCQIVCSILFDLFYCMSSSDGESQYFNVDIAGAIRATTLPAEVWSALRASCPASTRTPSTPSSTSSTDPSQPQTTQTLQSPS